MEYFIIYGLTIIAMLITLGAQAYISSCYKKYSKVKNEKGFTGKSICYNMIIPYMIYLAYNIVVKKRYKDIIYLLMAVGSTVAITDIQTGLVPALICLAVMTIIALVYKIGGMIKWR